MVADRWTEYELSLQLLASACHHETAALRDVNGLTGYGSPANSLAVEVSAGMSRTGLRDHLMTAPGGVRPRVRQRARDQQRRPAPGRPARG